MRWRCATRGTSACWSSGASRWTARPWPTCCGDGDRVLPLADAEEGRAWWQLDLLNELECVGELVYANVWRSDVILVIDGAGGEVRAIIDAAGLLSDEQRAEADVLNGIAWLPQRETFLLTGKLWPTLFRGALLWKSPPKTGRHH